MADDPLLQPPLRGDQRMEALAVLIARLSALPAETPLVNLIDIVPPPALPILGEQFHVMGDEGWNLARADGERRALIKRAIEIHRRKGTPWAVRTALSTAIGGTDIALQEWFEYGGEPYRFRLTLDIPPAGLRAEGLENARRLVEATKNVRSWLDYIGTSASIPCPLRHGLAVVCATRSEIKPWEPTGEAPDFGLRHGLAAVGRTLAEYAASNPETTAPALGARTALAVAGRTMATIH